MSKYVIEFDKEQLLEYDKDTDTYFRTLYKAKGFNALVFDKNGLDKLTPLDKELEEAYQKGVHEGSLDVKERVEGAYQKGYEAGQHEATTMEYQQGLEEGKKQAKAQAHLDVCHDIERVAHGNYQKGLDDAWEAAKKICTNWMIGNQTLAEIFGQCKDIDTIMHENTAQEAINKFKAYEQQKQEIKVGDEVEAFSGRAIVFGTFTDTKGEKFCRYWYPSDDSFNKGKTENLKKTGRHFPQVVELIKAMKEGTE